MQSSEHLDRYLAGGMAEVEGWCHAELWNVIEAVSGLQRELGLEAPVCEIGVYHGKFFLGLLNSSGSPRRSLAIDVFDRQEFNLDGAGVGSLERFRANLQRFARHPERVAIRQVDSLALKAHDVTAIAAEFGLFSLFSIDGCHTASHTQHDLALAEELTDPAGVIFLDDYYNPNWPGVQEGAARHFLLGRSRFVPFCYSCNKLLLASMPYHARYLERTLRHVRERYLATPVKLVERFGWRCANVLTPVRPAAAGQG